VVPADLDGLTALATEHHRAEAAAIVVLVLPGRAAPHARPDLDRVVVAAGRQHAVDAGPQAVLDPAAIPLHRRHAAADRQHGARARRARLAAWPALHPQPFGQLRRRRVVDHHDLGAAVAVVAAAAVPAAPVPVAAIAAAAVPLAPVVAFLVAVVPQHLDVAVALVVGDLDDGAEQVGLALLGVLVVPARAVPHPIAHRDREAVGLQPAGVVLDPAIRGAAGRPAVALAGVDQVGLARPAGILDGVGRVVADRAAADHRLVAADRCRACLATARAEHGREDHRASLHGCRPHQCACSTTSRSYTRPPLLSVAPQRYALFSPLSQATLTQVWPGLALVTVPVDPPP
jgi:hypothetical protein